MEHKIKCHSNHYLVSHDPVVLKAHLPAVVTTVKARGGYGTTRALQEIKDMSREEMVWVALTHSEVFTVRNTAVAQVLMSFLNPSKKS